jgi:hypothetical protein
MHFEKTPSLQALLIDRVGRQPVAEASPRIAASQTFSLDVL